MPATITPLKLEGIALRFGRKVVLRDVDMKLREGEIVGLMGANGAGKTTLFSVIAGLLPQDAGTCTFGDHRPGVFDVDVRSQLAYVAHTTQLYGGLSARENLELYADLRRAAGLKTQSSDEVLRVVGLMQAAERRVSTFSRGMSQRLGLARALAGRPKLMILDEPFTALDQRGKRQLASLLLQQKHLGTAILLSSHDLDSLVSVADRVLMLAGGKIAGEVRREQAGTVEALREQVHAFWDDAKRPLDSSQSMA